ncbi:UDP-glucuronosyltransferase 2B15-like [Spodoptera litura]|uniref:UDP-glucuronosyltransferase n=1 Tax=Spodoptera litura TaxID=69820 RepID=A0A9J7IIT8_SPOLT|nr:UDP-glucuronosyltransferase 2B15-like [Spodoptera litura]
MDKFRCLLFCVVISLCSCHAYKILAVFPMPSPSHGILGDNMVKHLLNAGHEVTYVTPYIQKQKNQTNLHLVDVNEIEKFFKAAGDMLDFKQILAGTVDLHDIKFMFQLLSTIADMTLGNPNVQRMMRDPQEKFDVIILEYMFHDMFSTFSAVFQCPYIWFSTIEPHWTIMNLVSGPMNPAYTTDYLQAQIPPFTFMGRVRELWTQIKGLYYHKFDFHDVEEAIYQKQVVPILKEQGKPVPDYNVLKYNASLLLGNSQVAMGNAVPLPPSYKHIGGYHIDEEVKPLPEDLKKILDNAKNGVIYFSMGSNLKSKELPDELKNGLLEVFGGLKQTVLWKFEENLPNQPKNVHIVQWAPQQSILAHPNLKLFVTHGGLLSLTEAVHFGVPVIAIPVFADQFLNANQARNKGFGERVDLSYHLHKDLKVTLDKVLGDLSKYTAKAKEISMAYHDSPMKPSEALNFWVEHVVRTRGAPHLRSVALQVPLYQQAYLDLLAVLLAATVVILLVVRRILSLLTSNSPKLKKN